MTNQIYLSPFVRHVKWFAAMIMLGGFAAAGMAHASTGAPVVNGTLLIPRNITYWEMFANATVIVKFVMILLAAASVLTWTIWIFKTLEIRDSRRCLACDIDLLGKATDLSEVQSLEHPAPVAMMEIISLEQKRSGKPASIAAAEGLKERVAARLQNVEASAINRMLRGASVLATVGAIAPFVGLFGTVWGIMNSFIGISESKTTNLAVVAPGIAEALLATAIGLVAAIPAVIMYNHVARLIAGYRRQLSEAAVNAACLLSHEVDAEFVRDAQSAKAA